MPFTFFFNYHRKAVDGSNGFRLLILRHLSSVLRHLSSDPGPFRLVPKGNTRHPQSRGLLLRAAVVGQHRERILSNN
jgi:hypothetical protein